MNKTQTKLHNLMLSILLFKEFRQNDVVEIGKENCEPQGIILYKHPVRNFKGKNIFEDYYCVLQTNDVETLCHISKIKFISRDWQLNDLLLAMNKKKYACYISNLLSKGGNTVEILTMDKLEDGFNYVIDIDLTKSLLNQEEETLKTIIGVLE